MHDQWVNPYLEPDLSCATKTAYQADIEAFTAFCAAHGIALAIPADTRVIARYLASIATTHAIATLRRHLRGIAFAHKLAGFDIMANGEEIRRTLTGIARRHGKPPRRAAALGLHEVKAMLATCPDTLTGQRDRAVILIGFAGGLRRSEIVAIEHRHLTWRPGAVRLLIERSKTDQHGTGAEITIPSGTHEQTCPVAALRVWIAAARIAEGPVFRGVDRWDNIQPEALHPDGVRRIVQRAARRAGLSVAAHETLSPHGLRAGFITEAHRANARDEDIMQHTRHKSLATMRSYVRRSDKMSDNPAGKIGL